MEFSMEFHGIPLNFMELRLMEFHGIDGIWWNSVSTGIVWKDCSMSTVMSWCDCNLRTYYYVTLYYKLISYSLLLTFYYQSTTPYMNCHFMGEESSSVVVFCTNYYVTLYYKLISYSLQYLLLTEHYPVYELPFYGWIKLFSVQCLVFSVINNVGACYTPRHRSQLTHRRWPRCARKLPVSSLWNGLSVHWYGQKGT
jgi:hypothetical protein